MEIGSSLIKIVLIVRCGANFSNYFLLPLSHLMVRDDVVKMEHACLFALLK